MVLIQLDHPPDDTSNYIELPLTDDADKTQRNLWRLIEQGTANIIVRCAPYQLINNLEPAIEANGYRVSLFPCPDSKTLADFYLEKFDEHGAMTTVTLSA